MKFDERLWECSINEAAEIFRKHGSDHWADSLVRAVNSPEYVRLFFGGMGSLNDIGFHDPEDDKRLQDALGRIFKMSDAIVNRRN